MFKRGFLFLATNLAVLALVSIVMSILGVNPRQFGGLLIMAALFGFGGSIISLLVSKWMAKRATGAHVIETPRNEAEAMAAQYGAPPGRGCWHRHARGRDLRCPGNQCLRHRHANRNNALVAVSTGLLRGDAAR
jgi:heat shock protein HtpX